MKTTRPEVQYLDWYEGCRERVDAYLRESVARLDLTPALRAAMNYSLLGPCKRVRAVLTMESCRIVGGDDGAAVPAAAALEMVHCFSLIHDDLPCMDDSDLRRNRASLHRHTNEALAVIAGDALFNAAFHALTTTDHSPETCLALCHELTSAATSLANGQVLDTCLREREDRSQPERLLEIHTQKTGGLFRAAARMGAICGGASQADLEALTAFGDRLGLLYQIVDDILDATGSSMVSGKPVGRDAALGRVCFPGVYGVECSRDTAAALHSDARSSLAPFDSRADRLGWLAATVAARAEHL